MMIREISIEELESLKNRTLIDVRSEGEYQEATIPGSLNLPLLNNEERVQVGTIYTQNSPALAREMGLQFVSPKLPDLVQRAGKLSEQGPLVLFCWRGGMRSKAMATVLDLMGVSVYRLQGGFKAYRKRVFGYFEQELPFKFIVLRGNTGVGKTEILTRLKRDGYPVIDLEKLANNRGSVFGNLGLGTPPSQKAFESFLYEELKEIRAKGYSTLLVECESKRIGRVTLPQKFHNAMQQGTQILVYDSIRNRVNRLLAEYSKIPEAIPQIRAALFRLDKTLGRKKVEQYNALLDENRLPEFTERLLVYYDALYGYPNESSLDYSLSIDYSCPERAIRELEDYLDEQVADSSPSPGSSYVQNSAK